MSRKGYWLHDRNICEVRQALDVIDCLDKTQREGEEAAVVGCRTMLWYARGCYHRARGTLEASSTASGVMHRKEGSCVGKEGRNDLIPPWLLRLCDPRAVGDNGLTGAGLKIRSPVPRLFVCLLDC